MRLCLVFFFLIQLMGCSFYQNLTKIEIEQLDIRGELEKDLRPNQTLFIQFSKDILESYQVKSNFFKPVLFRNFRTQLRKGFRYTFIETFKEVNFITGDEKEEEKQYFLKMDSFKISFKWEGYYYEPDEAVRHPYVKVVLDATGSIKRPKKFKNYVEHFESERISLEEKELAQATENIINSLIDNLGEKLLDQDKF